MSSSSDDESKRNEWFIDEDHEESCEESNKNGMKIGLKQ